VTRVATLLVLVLPAVACGQPAAEAYAPKGGNFSVRFAGPTKESSQTAASAIGDLKVVSAAYATADGNVFLTSYVDFPAEATKAEKRGSLLDGARDGIKGKDGKVISDKDTEFGVGKLPGREFEIEKGKQRLRFRLILRDDRLYQVAVIGSAAFVGGKEAIAFIESFELTPVK